MTTAAELDPAPKLGEYAHPERLVTTAWLAEHLDDPNLVVAESDEDVLLYETGHIPGAVKIDWHLDLNDPVERDYVSGEGFARLMSSKGISRDTTVVFYGDNQSGPVQLHSRPVSIHDRSLCHPPGLQRAYLYSPLG